jgi:hypothetical protein
MKYDSILSKLKYDEAELSLAAAEQRKRSGGTSFQKFLADKNKGKQTFFQKADIQKQKYEQKKKMILADTLKAQGWLMGASGGDTMVFGNPKSFPGLYLQVNTKDDTFMIFDKTATGYPNFVNQKPIVGPLSLDQLEDQLKDPTVPIDNPVSK